MPHLACPCATPVCLCASRILIQDTADGFYERFASAFAERAARLRLGHPAEESTDLGPVVSAEQREKILGYVSSALQAPGVRLRSGGPSDARVAVAAATYNGGGHWIAPTVLDGCALDAPIAQEEVFGPVVTLHRFVNEADAIAAANGTAYGLAASVWTENIKRAHTVSHALDAGTVWVNTWLHRQLHMPFGGFRNSGVAREGGEASLDFFSETSTVCVKLGSRQPPAMPGLHHELHRGHSSRADVSRLRQAAAGAATATDRTGLRKHHQQFMHTSSAASGAALVTSSDELLYSAPKPLGTYSHARRVGGLLYLAGLGPRDPRTDMVPGGPIEDQDGGRAEYDAAAQTRACIANVQGVLSAHGLGLSDVVDVQCFLVDMKRDFADFNAEYNAAFGGLDEPPTRTTVQVAELPPGGRIAVELKVIARCEGETKE